MIPRRRTPLAGRDLGDLLRGLGRSRARNAAEVAAFEAEFAAHVGVPHALATASGRDALELIVDALGLQAGDEVIVPAYTLGELLPLLQGRGLVLVAADVDPASYNLTAATVAARLTPRTRAVLVLHLFGAPCDVAGVAGVAGRDIAVIEDCAHALGASVAGRPVGSFGRAALFSFESNKILPTFGGGMVATADAALAARIRARLDARRRSEWATLRQALLRCGEELLVRSPLYAVLARLLFDPRIAPHFERLYRGAYRQARAETRAYSGAQAAIGRRRLAAVAARNTALNNLWERLAAALPAGLVAQQRDRHGHPAFYNFVVRYRGELAGLRRRALAAGLDVGIGSEVMDDTARLLGQVDCPVAAAVHAEAMQLPLHDGVAATRVAGLAQQLRRLLGDAR